MAAHSVDECTSEPLELGLGPDEPSSALGFSALDVLDRITADGEWSVDSDYVTADPPTAVSWDLSVLDGVEVIDVLQNPDSVMPCEAPGPRMALSLAGTVDVPGWLEASGEGLGLQVDEGFSVTATSISWKPSIEPAIEDEFAQSLGLNCPQGFDYNFSFGVGILGVGFTADCQEALVGGSAFSLWRSP